MKAIFLLLITLLTTFIFTGCQSNNISMENQSLKKKISELEYQLTQVQENKHTPNISQANETSISQGSISQNTIINNSNQNTKALYTIDELSAMVDEFVASVGSVPPELKTSSNLDQFFSLKRQGNQIEHALENYENELESQYRTSTITREKYRKLEWEIEQLEEVLDSANDRLEITFGIDD